MICLISSGVVLGISSNRQSDNLFTFRRIQLARLRHLANQIADNLRLFFRRHFQSVFGQEFARHHNGAFDAVICHLGGQARRQLADRPVHQSPSRPAPRKNARRVLATLKPKTERGGDLYCHHDCDRTKAWLLRLAMCMQARLQGDRPRSVFISRGPSLSATTVPEPISTLPPQLMLSPTRARGCPLTKTAADPEVWSRRDCR